LVPHPTSHFVEQFHSLCSQGLRAKDEYALPMIARKSIRDEYEVDKKEQLLEKFKDELLGTEIKLTADYTAIWKGLVDGKKVKIFINYR